MFSPPPQIAKAKEDMLANFLTTVTKVSRLSAGLFPMKSQLAKQAAVTQHNQTITSQGQSFTSDFEVVS